MRLPRSAGVTNPGRSRIAVSAQKTKNNNMTDQDTSGTPAAPNADTSAPSAPAATAPASTAGGETQPFGSFRECISVAADHTLETLREDFEDNGDLLPAVPTQ